MNDSLIIFHEDFIEADDVFRIIVSYHFQVPEFPLEYFFVGYEVGDLDIYFFCPVFRYEIDFVISEVSDIYRVSMQSQVVVDDIFQFSPGSDIVARREIVIESQIVKIIFLLSFEYFFSLEVEALASMYDVGFFQILEVVPDSYGIGIYVDSLQFFHDRIERKKVSDIAGKVQKQFFQKIDVLDPVALHYVFEDNGVFQGFQKIYAAFVVGYFI